MDQWSRIGLSALISGGVASVFSTAALSALSKVEGKGVLQPTRATGHWLYGDKVARRDDVDATHTLVGYGTHHASAVFWALPFQFWLVNQSSRPSPMRLLGDACVISAIAAVVDYGATPKRLTPGWELVLSKQSIVATYGALALGLAAGALIADTVFDAADK